MTRLTDAFGVLHDFTFEGWRWVISQNAVDGTKPRGTFAASVRREDESDTQVFYGNTFLEVLRAAAFFIADSLDAEAAEDADVVSYTLAGAVGSPAQHVLESRTRFATRNDDEHGWLIGTKRPSALARPISDWDYEELFYLSEQVFVLESEAARWVAEGGAPLKDSVVEWRSPFERKAKP